jgi:hypothetical protein
MTTLTATPQKMEIIPVAAGRRIFSFHTPIGYFSLTDATTLSDGDASLYYDIRDTAYEDDGLSLYFESHAKFQGEYDVVTLRWPMDKKVIDFLAGNLFLGTPLRLSLNKDGRNRMQ